MSAGGSGRYTRRNSGMLGAMVVTIGVLIAFIAFRAVTRDDMEIEREAIDYLPVVAAIQEGAEMEIAYPPVLPEGVKAVNVNFDPTREWALDLLTGSNRYVGIYQGRRPMVDMVEKYIDQEASQGEDVTLDSAIADTWLTWTDEGGDYGVGVQLEDTFLLVFGTADEQEIRDLAASLVTTPLTDEDAERDEPRG